MKKANLLTIIFILVILISKLSFVSAASVYDYKNSNKETPYIDTSHMERVGYWTTENIGLQKNIKVRVILLNGSIVML